VDFPRVAGVGEHRDVTEPRTPVERALDVLFYAPLGVATNAREVVPELAAQGRARVGKQLTTARLVGEFAIRRLRRRADAVLVELGLTAEQRAPWARDPVVDVDVGVTAAAPDRASSNGRAGAPNGDRPDPGTLAIPAYDSLSASQVVQRLNGLSRGELEAVRAYEHAGRGRKTILTRVAQLQAAAS
jgi:hypothetical protein